MSACRFTEIDDHVAKKIRARNSTSHRNRNDPSRISLIAAVVLHKIDPAFLAEYRVDSLTRRDFVLRGNADFSFPAIA
jgi:hypothetical protein